MPPARFDLTEIHRANGLLLDLGHVYELQAFTARRGTLRGYFQQPWLLNCFNWTINLKTGDLLARLLAGELVEILQREGY